MISENVNLLAKVSKTRSTPPGVKLIKALYICPLCGRKFTRKDHVDRHVKANTCQKSDDAPPPAKKPSASRGS